MTELIKCKVCREPERRRLIDADFTAGLSASAIARRMTLGGWKIGDVAVLNHLKAHYEPPDAPPGVAKTKRDAAVFVRDKLMERLEKMDEGGTRQVVTKIGDVIDIPLDILDKDLQPAIGSVLKAQALLDKREENKANVRIGLFQLMLGGPDGSRMLAPLELSTGDEVEGEAIEID